MRGMFHSQNSFDLAHSLGVAQTFSLLYRRFSTCGAPRSESSRFAGRPPQTENLRYGGLKTCDTQ